MPRALSFFAVVRFSIPEKEEEEELFYNLQKMKH
jgi:hypothetical protein